MSNLEKKVEYLLNKSEILNIPIIIDLKEIESYSNNINRLKQKYKYNFYLKKELKLKKDEEYYKCELNIKKDVKTLNIDILNSEDIYIDIINPGNNCLESLSIDSIKNNFDLGDTTIVIRRKDKKI